MIMSTFSIPSGRDTSSTFPFTSVITEIQYELSFTIYDTAQSFHNLGMEAFENIKEKGEMLVTSIFFFQHNVFESSLSIGYTTPIFLFLQSQRNQLN